MPRSARGVYKHRHFARWPMSASKSVSWRILVKELARFLLQNAQLDFSGEITIDQIRQFLRDDDSREARALLAKLIEDKGVDEMLVTIADCLKEYIPEHIPEDVVHQQLAVYSES